MPLARRRQRHNRRKAATTPSARVLVAWEEAAEAFSIAGIPPKGPETYREFAQRASTATPVPRSAMRALADDASAAQFSGDPLPEDVAERAEATVTEIETALERVDARGPQGARQVRSAAAAQARGEAQGAGGRAPGKGVKRRVDLAALR